MPRAIVLEVGERFGRWTVIGKNEESRWNDWHVRCDCGALGSVNVSQLRRGTSTQCRSCGMRAMHERLGHNKSKPKPAPRRPPEPKPEPPDLASPEDIIEEHTEELAREWVVDSVTRYPERWPPFLTYAGRDYRATPHQGGFVISHTALVFPVRLRETGIDPSPLKRQRIIIGKQGRRTLTLAVQPHPVTLPHDVFAAWRAVHPDVTGESVDDTAAIISALKQFGGEVRAVVLQGALGWSPTRTKSAAKAAGLTTYVRREGRGSPSPWFVLDAPTDE